MVASTEILTLRAFQMEARSRYIYLRGVVFKCNKQIKIIYLYVVLSAIGYCHVDMLQAITDSETR